MLIIKHTQPKRLLGHLRRLQRDGEALIGLARMLTMIDESKWEIRVWRCLDKIVANPKAFEGALKRDIEDLGGKHLDRPRTIGEIDRLLRRRISRRLGTLASVIEKVEAQIELPEHR